MVRELVTSCGENLMLIPQWIRCVVAEAHGYGSNSASAPTLTKLGNSCFETAGSRVVGSSERDRVVLDEVDDVDCQVLDSRDV